MNYELLQNNKVYLFGTVLTPPVFSHEVLGEGFYDLTLSVKRLSGQTDEIPLTLSERLMENNPLDVGKELCVSGQLRSYNKVENERSRLVLRVFVREIISGDADNPNYIEIEGFLCKDPIYRTTPFGREICDMLLAVNRAYNKSDYIPSIAWGRNARYAGNFKVGDKVKIIGRIQSRVYQKVLEGGETEDRIAYEVSVGKLEKTTD